MINSVIDVGTIDDISTGFIGGCGKVTSVCSNLKQEAQPNWYVVL